MQKYELMVIIKPLLPEDIKTKLLDGIEAGLKEFGGKILETEVWGKRHLAYPINKHDEGYYLIYQIELPSDNTAQFDRKLKLESGILRFVRIKAEEI